MTVKVVVVGAGGFGREALDVIEAVNGAATSPFFEVLGVLDSGPSEMNLTRLAARGIRFLGDEDAWLGSGSKAQYLIGIGSPTIRQRIDEKFVAAGLAAATVVHPSATVGTQVELAAGVVICGGAQVSTNVTLGRHVHVNPNATIGHDSRLGEFVSINPAATVSGEVTIGDRVLVGVGSVILQGLSIGADSVIGASACVVCDLPNGVVVKGVPAR